MTCIVGYKKNKKVWIGGDSMAYGSVSHKTITSQPKVFIVSDGTCEAGIGCTTSFRMMQLLRYKFKMPKVGRDIFKYMCTDFVDSVIDCFAINKCITTEKGVASGGRFLVGLKGNLYEIQEDFQVSESKENFAAIGCGFYYALGAMQILDKMQLTPEDKIAKSIQIASVYSQVCAPITIINV